MVSTIAEQQRFSTMNVGLCLKASISRPLLPPSAAKSRRFIVRCPFPLEPFLGPGPAPSSGLSWPLSRLALRAAARAASLSLSQNYHDRQTSSASWPAGRGAYAAPAVGRPRLWLSSGARLAPETASWPVTLRVRLGRGPQGATAAAVLARQAASRSVEARGAACRRRSVSPRRVRRARTPRARPRAPRPRGLGHLTKRDESRSRESLIEPWSAGAARSVNLLDGGLHSCAISRRRWATGATRRGDPSGVPLEQYRAQLAWRGAARAGW